MSKSSFRRLLPLGLLLTAVGCSGGLDCGSGCADAYVFPQTSDSVPNGAEFVDDGVRMRMSQSGLDFIVANLKPILATQLGNDPNNPDHIVIPIPNTNLGSGISLGQGQQEVRPGRIIIDATELAERMTVQFTEAPAEGILIRIDDIPFGVEARVFGELDGFADAACDIVGTNNTYGGFPFLTGITFEMLITPRVGRGAECDEAGGQGECIKLNVDVREVGIGDFGSGAIAVNKPARCTTQVGRSCARSSDCAVGSNCFSGQCVGDGNGACSEDCSDNRICASDLDFTCINNPADSNGDVECSGACGVSNFFVDIAASIVGFVEPIIEPLLDNIMETAINNALEDIDGAPLTASGRFPLNTAAPGILPASALDLGFAVGPTGNAFDVSTPAGGTLGMDLVLKSGFEAAPSLDPASQLTVPHPCVRPIEGLEWADLYTGGTATQFNVPDNLLSPLTGRTNGEQYDLGASISKATINQALFALYNSGALCLEIGSDAINELTGGQFQLSAATLDLLTQGKLKQYADPNAPAIVALNPSKPPIISYGAGTVDEGHIILEFKDVEVSFYVLMFERFSRVFAVSTDISMQIAVFNEPGTETLRISVVDGPNVDNFRENYNELLPGVSFVEVMESLIGIAFDAALGDGLEFNYDVGNTLSDLLGIPVFIDFQGIETVPASQREVLNVYLSMTDTPPQPRTVGRAGLTLARNPGVLRMPDAEDFGTVTRATMPTGEVILDVDDAWDREFFARVDFGAWRGPMLADGHELVVQDPKLRLTGEHTITVRSRMIDRPNSLDEVGETVSVWVDAQLPVAELVRVGDTLVVKASDDGTAAADLQYAWQIDDNHVGDFGDVSELKLDDVDATYVSVVARDLAGNISKPSSVNVRIERARLKEDLREQAIWSGGCAATSTMSLWPAGLLALALLVRRRRQR